MDMDITQRRQLLQIYSIALKNKLIGIDMAQTSRNRYIRWMSEEE